MLLAVGADDVIVGASRSARLELKLSDNQLREGTSARDLLEATLDDIHLAERGTIRRAFYETAEMFRPPQFH